MKIESPYVEPPFSRTSARSAPRFQEGVHGASGSCGSRNTFEVG